MSSSQIAIRFHVNAADDVGTIMLTYLYHPFSQTPYSVYNMGFIDNVVSSLKDIFTILTLLDS